MKDFLKYIKANQARLLPLGILLFLAIATLLTFYLTTKRQETRTKATTAEAELTFSVLDPMPIAPGEEVRVAVNLTAGNLSPVGADILVNFDTTKLTLEDITPGFTTNVVYKTFTPIITPAPSAQGAVFDESRVINCANNGISQGASCSDEGANGGVVEFGIVAFDWATDGLPSPNPTNTDMAPVATLTFRAKTTAQGQATLSFIYDTDNPTRDSNVALKPEGDGSPEDVLKNPNTYPNSTATITFTAGSSPPPSAGPSPTPAPSPTTPPPSGQKANVSFKVVFEGLEEIEGRQPTDKVVNVQLKQNGQVVKEQDVTFKATAEIRSFYQFTLVVYSSELDPIVNVDTNYYDVFVKGPVHLTKKFGVSVATTEPLDLTNEYLRAGDSVWDQSDPQDFDTIEDDDFTNLFENLYCPNLGPGGQPLYKSSDQCSYVSDLNYDAIIDEADWNYMSGNFNESGD